MKTSILTILLATSLVAALSGCSKANANSTNYFVDPTEGNDNNAGTSATTPWKSLSKVNNLDLEPGDTINLRAGRVFNVDHPHTVLFFSKGVNNGVPYDDSGTPENPVIVRSYGEGDKPLIEQTFNTNYNSAVVGFQGPVSNVIIDGIHMKGIKGPYNTTNGKDGLDVFSTALLNYEGNEYSSNVTIKNCEIEGGCRGLLLFRCVNYNIENNYIHDVNGANTNTRDWPTLWPENHVKKNEPGYNLDKNTNPSGLDNDSGAEAIDLSSYCRNIRIASNTVNNVQYDSYDYGPDGTFVEVYGSDIRNIEVCYNTISDIPGGTIEMGHYGGGTVDGFNFHHNLIREGSTLYGIHANGMYGLSEILNIQFNNNTFVQRLIEDDTKRPWSIFDVNGTIAKPEDVKVQNNIFYLLTGTKVLWNGGPASDMSAMMGNDDVFTHKNNIFRRHPGAPGTYRFTIPLDTSEFADLDPKFADLANGDLTLAANSPAVNTGLNLGYTRDLTGNPVPSGNAPDIGAFEWTNSPITAKATSTAPKATTTTLKVAPVVAKTPANTPKPFTTPTQLAIKEAMAGAEEPGNFKNRAYDGNNETRWCNDGTVANAWIQLDLGATYKVSKVRLMMENGHMLTCPLKVEVGDSTKFTTVFEGDSRMVDYKTFQDITFAPTAGRYVKISMTGKTTEKTTWYSLWEVQAIGTS